ncbi:hypothetical protein VTK26DRAFT_379 [Humicola hyalothermophila]
MARTQVPKLSPWALLLHLANLVSASPIQPRALVERDTTVTTTVFIEPTTITVNPNDPTITRDAGWTTTVGPPPITNTITSSCITYDFSYPPEFSTSTTTETVTTRSTITVTDTTRPLQTHFSFHTPTVTVTTPRGTVVSLHCLNTMVVQYHSWEHLTWTWSQWAHTAVTTGLCVTTSTRSTTIPGATPPAATATRALEDWEYFGEPGQSVVTKHSTRWRSRRTRRARSTARRRAPSATPRATRPPRPPPPSPSR